MWKKVLILCFIIMHHGKSQIKKSDIKIYFYSKLNRVLGNTIDVANQLDLNIVGFSKKRDTVFLIHGFMERPTLPLSSSQAIKNSILSKYDANVIVVDYSKFSTSPYIVAVQQVKHVGQTLALMINDMVQQFGLDLKKTKMVGVSLGAHVAGVTGHALGGEIDQLVGVDPAGPLFSIEQNSNRISRSSAKFVQVIHTDGGRFGFYEPLGHADYYVNGGRNQPACGPIPFGLCSHILSVSYYSESLISGNFLATKCESNEKFKQRKCNGKQKSWMGQFDVDKMANGNYFLDTNQTPPYAKG